MILFFSSACNLIRVAQQKLTFLRLKLSEWRLNSPTVKTVGMPCINLDKTSTSGCGGVWFLKGSRPPSTPKLVIVTLSFACSRRPASKAVRNPNKFVESAIVAAELRKKPLYSRTQTWKRDIAYTQFQVLFIMCAIFKEKDHGTEFPTFDY